jgi:formylglycine-generating enzyme required for sulfatase activity
MPASPFTLPLLEWLDIPAGTVTLADGAGEFEVPPFKIAKYPVFNAQFRIFIDSGGYKEPLWWEGLAFRVSSPRASDRGNPGCPKQQVTWFEAVAFCRWLSHETELDVRLPTEWEWQWAAAGDSGWDYPYGSTFNNTKCNTKDRGLRCTNVVTEYESVKTHFGTVDMSGNVWEWCLNEGIVLDNIQLEGGENRALRGGSWNNPAKNASVQFRSHRNPRTRTFNIGFRVMAAT